MRSTFPPSVARVLGLHGPGARVFVKGSYFADCERDDEGRCLPSGESEGGSHDLTANKPKAPTAKPAAKDDKVEIHDHKTGESFGPFTRAEAEQMLVEQEAEEPGHGLKIRDARPVPKPPDAKKEESAETLPPPSNYQAYATGSPIKEATVYRGETIGGPGSGMAALGHGRYYALEPAVAMRFSKRDTVRASKVSLANPVVVHSDEEMRALKQEAEKETGIDFGKTGNLYELLIGNQPAAFTAYLVSKGYDGIVTTYKEAAGGRQLVVFGKQSAAKSLPPYPTKSTPPAPAASGTGFTGQKKDKLGHTICYADGIRVPCATDEAKKEDAADATQTAQDVAKPAGGESPPATPAGSQGGPEAAAKPQGQQPAEVDWSDPKFSAEWDAEVAKHLDEVEANNVRDFAFDAQQTAAEQDWHGQYMQWRWGLQTGAGAGSNAGKFSLRPADIGVASRFVSGLLNPIMGGAAYIAGLIDRFIAPNRQTATPADPAIGEQLQKLFGDAGIEPETSAKASELLAEFLGPQAVAVAKTVVQKPPKVAEPLKPPQAGERAAEADADTRTPEQKEADFQQLKQEAQARGPSKPAKDQNVAGRVDKAKVKAQAKQRRLDQMTPAERQAMADAGRAKLAKKRERQEAESERYWKRRAKEDERAKRKAGKKSLSWLSTTTGGALVRPAATTLRPPRARGAGKWLGRKSFGFRGAKSLPQQPADDLADKLSVIADILLGIYGDNAIHLLSSADAADAGAKGLWVATDHPRDHLGRFIQKGEAGAHAASQLIRDAQRGRQSSVSVHDLTKQLAVLTVKQLKALRAQHGLAVRSGPLKKQLVAMLAERIWALAAKAEPAAPAQDETVGGRKPELVGGRRDELVSGKRKTQLDAPDPITADNPRAAAAELEEAKKSDYIYARESDIPNVGEDLLGSARHIRNAWRGLADAESNGTAEELVTRDKLLKNEPMNLLAEVKDNGSNSLASLAAHLAMNKFPKSPDAHWTADKLSPDDKKELRAKYLESFRKFKGMAESLAQSQSDPTKVLESLRGELRKDIDAIGGSTMRYAGSSPTDKVMYNLLAGMYNALIVSRYRPKANQVHAQLLDFADRLKKAYGADVGSSLGHGPDKDMLAKAAEHVKDIIEGESFNKTFGTVSKKEGELNAADLYVKHAERKGGPALGIHDTRQAVNHMMDTQRMRGIQWGNSVTDDERKHHAKMVAESFADLTDIVGLPEAFASLNGKLGLAIGARGKGGALAHYETGRDIINLTRKGGVGSLAHEWGHFFDNALAGGGANFFSERNGSYGMQGNGEMPKAFVALAKTQGAFRSRLNQHVHDLVRKGVMSPGKADYWKSTTECFARSFERYVQRKLHKQDRENTYLTGLRKEGHPLWPTDAEVDAMTPAFDAIFEAYKKQHKQ